MSKKIDIDRIRNEVQQTEEKMTFDFGVGIDGEDRQTAMREAYRYLQREGEMDVQDVEEIVTRRCGAVQDVWITRRALPALREKPGVVSLRVWRVEGDVIHDDRVLDEAVTELVTDSLRHASSMKDVYRQAYRRLRDRGDRNIEELKDEVNVVMPDQFWSRNFPSDFRELPGVRPPEEDGPDFVFVETEEERETAEVGMDG